MKVYDQHLHTYFSDDSKETYENYLKIAKRDGDTHFVATDHVDLEKASTGKDRIPDFKGQIETIKQLEEEYAIKMLLGVEIGYKPSVQKRLEDIVRGYPFDAVILSIHESEESAVGHEKFLTGYSNDEIYTRYLDLYLKAVSDFQDYDILGHIDFILRYIGAVEMKKHEQELEKIYKHVIQNQKSLELNTRFFYQKKELSYLETILDVYKQCGGEWISLGSDCHEYENFKGGFEEAKAFMKRFGFSELTVFEQRKAKQIEI